MWTFHRRRWALQWAIVAAICHLAVGCSCARGPINASPAIRWWLFSNFGANQMCPQILKTGVPLRLEGQSNTIGRFFPDQCHHQVNDQAQTVSLFFGGTGYAWTPVAGRVGFRATAAVEYRMDFYMAEDAVYVWGKPHRTLAPPEFSLDSVEYKVVDWASRTPVGYLAQTFGGQIMASQLSSGFTVVRTDSGDEFALGHLRPPARPPKPFNLPKGRRLVYANETTEVRAEQVDFLGPFEVAREGQALFFRFNLAGPPAEALLWHQSVADIWRRNLQVGAALSPPPEAPAAGIPLQPGVPSQRKVPLPPGQYYLVIDNSSRVGQVNPPWNPLNMVGASAAVLSYTAELGDAEDEF